MHTSATGHGPTLTSVSTLTSFGDMFPLLYRYASPDRHPYIINTNTIRRRKRSGSPLSSVSAGSVIRPDRHVYKKRKGLRLNPATSSEARTRTDSIIPEANIPNVIEVRYSFSAKYHLLIYNSNHGIPSERHLRPFLSNQVALVPGKHCESNPTSLGMSDLFPEAPL